MRVSTERVGLVGGEGYSQDRLVERHEGGDGATPVFTLGSRSNGVMCAPSAAKTTRLQVEADAGVL